MIFFFRFGIQVCIFQLKVLMYSLRIQSNKVTVKSRQFDSIYRSFKIIGNDIDIFSFKILNIFLYLYTELFFLRDQ